VLNPAHEVCAEQIHRAGDGIAFIEMEPAWVAANIVLQEVPIIGRVRISSCMGLGNRYQPLHKSLG
jgi:hypothetical protein